MRVTIDIDKASIVVPCGEGKSTIRELKDLAVFRYKKVFNKPASCTVYISGFKLAGTQGMLDPDDIICEVCNDDDHLIACLDSNDNGDPSPSGQDCDRMSSISEEENEEGFWDNSGSSSNNSTAGAAGAIEETRTASCLNSVEKTKDTALKVYLQFSNCY